MRRISGVHEIMPVPKFISQPPTPPTRAASINSRLLCSRFSRLAASAWSRSEPKGLRAALRGFRGRTGRGRAFIFLTAWGPCFYPPIIASGSKRTA
jgi:hypothetical protein